MRHALGSLLTSDALVLPASATVYMQAVELRSGAVAGLDMSAANQHRWHPAYAAGAPLALGCPGCCLPFPTCACRCLRVGGLGLRSVRRLWLDPAALPTLPRCAILCLCSSAGVPLAADRIVALSKPKEVWHFDLGSPPEKSDVKAVDLEFTR